MEAIKILLDFLKKYIIILLKTKGKDMLNELKKMMVEKFSADHDALVSENELLENKVCLLLEENNNLKAENSKLKENLDTALDEIVLCQTRINAILKQLKDKSGGRW